MACGFQRLGLVPGFFLSPPKPGLGALTGGDARRSTIEMGIIGDDARLEWEVERPSYGDSVCIFHCF